MLMITKMHFYSQEMGEIDAENVIYDSTKCHKTIYTQMYIYITYTS